MASLENKRPATNDSAHRATAVHHARMIEEKKQLRTRVTDLVLEAYDLPSSKTCTPSDPSPSDLKVFKEGLKYFQPSDFDDLVTERNIDDRCGYALCPHPNRKARHQGEKVWNQKGGKDFQLLDRRELERWCSQECEARGVFAKAQLSTEPAWLRDSHHEIRLLDEVEGGDLSSKLKQLSLDSESTHSSENLAAKMRELALERGEPRHGAVEVQDVSEKASHGDTASAPIPGDADLIEGHQPKGERSRGESKANKST